MVLNHLGLACSCCALRKLTSIVDLESQSGTPSLACVAGTVSFVALVAFAIFAFASLPCQTANHGLGAPLDPGACHEEFEMHKT